MIIMILGAIALGTISILYLLLGLGFPLGFLAWGGKYKGVLPKQLRIQSIVSIPAQLFAIFVLLKLGDDSSNLILVFAYVYMIFFSVNIVMNLMSKSLYERIIMTPIAIYIVFSFVYGLFIY